MNDIKYILNRISKRFYAPLIGAALDILIMAMIIFVPVEDEADYLAYKLMSQAGVIIFAMMSALGIIHDVSNGKLMRSSPIAKKLYTRAVPLYGITITLLPSIFNAAVYFIFILITDKNMSDFSDILLWSGAVDFWYFCLSTAAMNLEQKYGIFLMLYSYFPIFLTALPVFKEFMKNGFGLPVHISLFIFLALILAGCAAALTLSRILYFKTNPSFSNQNSSCV